MSTPAFIFSGARKRTGPRPPAPQAGAVPAPTSVGRGPLLRRILPHDLNATPEVMP